ncbi:MAG: DUF3685 domain-containing protein [Spirulina sp. DLM2.Bin59]|nr:MAG: DUF3685 domain-containing protein [Spirulina sp. DLM2.Bin59]
MITVVSNPASGAIPLLLLDPDPVFRLGLTTAWATESSVDIVAAGDLSLGEQYWPQSRPLITLIDCGGDWGYVERVRRSYPDRPLILLTPCPQPGQRQQLQSLGVAAYCPKGASLETLLATIRQVAQGQTRWPEPALRGQTAAPQFPNRPPRWLHRLRQSGLEQIEAALAELRSPLATAQGLDRWLLQGRQRELRLARWCVHQLLPVEVVFALTPPPDPPGAIVPIPEPYPLLGQFLTAVQGGLINQTGQVLEIDVLRGDRRAELVYITVQTLKQWCDQARFLQLDPDTIRRQSPEILRDLWQQISLEWLRRYPIGGEVRSLAPAWPQNANLPPMPHAGDFLAHLIHATPITIDQVEYRGESPEAQARAALLRDHLIIQLSNGVMAWFLNRSGDEEDLKYQLYESRYFSTRSLTRFRNELSWQFRQNTYLREPKAIFESRYWLFYQTAGVIKQTNIYGARGEELAQLTGIPWFVTIALETRDAIAPRVRNLIAWLGEGVVYLLTQVIGRGLGLIGRGIAQGLGNSLPRSSDRPK